MKYHALTIKNWLIQEISPMGWSMLISRALPELLESNHRFSPYYIGKGTKWDKEQIDIIQFYLKKLYKIEIPASVLNSKTATKSLSWNSINSSPKIIQFKKGLKKLFDLIERQG